MTHLTENQMGTPSLLTVRNWVSVPVYRMKIIVDLDLNLKKVEDEKPMVTFVKIQRPLRNISYEEKYMS